MLPLAGFTVAVNVTGEFCATAEPEAASDVVVLVTLALGVTARLNVALCTRSPLIPQMVTGTVCATDVDDAAKVRVEVPPIMLGVANEAVTPAGSPEMLRFTAPKLNEFTRTIAVATPEVIA